MKKIAIIGHFGIGGNYLDGQTIKTKIITKELISQFGNDQVVSIDTHGGKKVLPKLFFRAISALHKTKNVVMLPAHNGIKFFTPILTVFNKIFKRKLFYIVIGGWLPEYLKDKKGLEKRLKKFDGIFVETNTMKTALVNMGFQNIFVMPNCKDLKILSKEEMEYPSGEPYKLCTFSRVCKEKGIEDAVNAVKAVNEQIGRTVYLLDIYGQVDKNQTEWFEYLKATFPEYITYRGMVEYDKSVDVLKDYFALLFPTHYYTEGIPGTIIDAYAAGVPVVCTRWENFFDIIKDSVTGIGYDFDDKEGLKQVLEKTNNEPKILNLMKEDCIKLAQMFIPSNAIKIFLEQIQ